MVEITYQMVLSTIQTVSLVVGIMYYIAIMRNAQKARKTELVSRILEQGGRSYEGQLQGVEIMEMQWTDFDDFLAKYDSTVNPENFAKRVLWWDYYQEIGYMLHEGLADVDTVYNLLGGNNSLLVWGKFESIILEQRKRYRDPSYYKYFEYFADEMKKYRVSQGMEAEIVDADGYLNR
jgi:hypothetical protein